MTAPAEVVVEQDVDRADNLGHWMCMKCQGRPVMGAVYRTYCGALKRYRGPRLAGPLCNVCGELRRRPCERCSE